MKCDKCGHDEFPEWKSGETYLGLDKHHNPPEEISRFLKEEWSGEFFSLCRPCHIKLHKEITNILKKYSSSPRYNSDFWLMFKSTPKEIKQAKEEIYLFTKQWIQKEDDTSTA